MASQDNTNDTPQPNRFMVIFKKGTPDKVVQDSMDAVKQQGGTIHHEYTSLMQGYSATLPEGFTQQLQGHEHVHLIEPDSEVHTMAPSN
ncbi:hypothetical protein H4R35_003541 [Dimargaris xerosporica]|nr:hypothetical protein H4R35_003541 [Dimargaris xerosporica]